MTRLQALIGSAVFLVIAPGSLVVLLPWLLSGWHLAPAPAWAMPLRAIGGVLILAGAPLLLDSFRRFAVEGLGTPAPVAAPDRLVVRGAYRFVRNPMYVAVAATIVGQALLFWNLRLFVEAITLWIGFDLFVRFYEEPVLRERFGHEYETFCAQVPRWIPRLR